VATSPGRRELGEDILKLQDAIKEACGGIEFNIW
jgi:hypothetical protein